MASAKQLAARRKFAKIMKAGGFKKKKAKTVKKSPVRKRKSATIKRKPKAIKRRTSSKPVMKRRSSRTRSVRRGAKGLGSSLKTGMIGDIVKGMGGAAVARQVIGRVAPQYADIASIGAGFVTGCMIGGAANLVLTGGLQSLGGMFGGASSPVEVQGV